MLVSYTLIAWPKYRLQEKYPGVTKFGSLGKTKWIYMDALHESMEGPFTVGRYYGKVRCQLTKNVNPSTPRHLCRGLPSA